MGAGDSAGEASCGDGVTACKECKHSTPERECHASPLVPFDYWHGRHALDKPFQFKWCWEVNTDGNCQKYEAKNAEIRSAAAAISDPAVHGR